MSRGPTVDGRSRDALRSDLGERARSYTDGWDLDSPDNGTALLDVGASFGADLLRRLDRLPAKHRQAFLAELGFDRRPPRAARLPLSVSVTDGHDRNVPVPEGTAAVAETDDGERTFTTTAGFEATPATLSSVYGVDPAQDRLVDHADLLDGEPTQLFAGSDRQRHLLAIGDSDLLALDAGATLTVDVGTDGPVSVFRSATWEYYGEDESGQVGWHALDATPGHGYQQSADSVACSFALPGPTVETTVDGVESRWVRCRVTADPAAFGAAVDSVRLSTERSGDGATPAAVYANDVPVSVEDDWRPFGRVAQPPSSLYVAAPEALSTPGARVTLQFDPSADGGSTAGTVGAGDAVASPFAGPPELSWEYWTGSGWAPLPDLDDGTASLRSAGAVRFRVPTDLEPTAVSGHESHWVRARLVSGSYGERTVDVSEDGSASSGGEQPQFGGLSVSFDREPATASTLRTVNNGTTVQPDREGSFEPFEGLAAASQTLYLGFDAPLRGGPLVLFCRLDGVAAVDTDACWEYCADPARGAWERLSVEDGTDGLTESGIVTFSLPESTTAFERFGQRRHWLRVRLAGSEFGVEEGPTLRGLHPNTQWAENARRVEAETLGSSDGTPDQRFDCARSPVLEGELWVDEAGALSEAEREALLSARPEAVERVMDAAGQLQSFWVRWRQADSLGDCGPADRCYTLDRTAGRVRFGDGEDGMVPPAGVDNIETTYRTGGGDAGNVEVGAVTTLSSSLSLVESVTNHAPADGGADAEPVDAVADRVGSTLRTGERAVTARDFEAIARQAGRGLGAVTCEAGPDGATLSVVPETDGPAPAPTRALCERIADAVAASAPVTLGDGDGSAVSVQGPRYAAVSVAVTVRAAGGRPVSSLREATRTALDRYLHPLSGGPDGEGWAFGTLPEGGELASMVAAVDGIAAVSNCSVTVALGGTERRLDRASLPSAGLVRAGDHEVTVSGGALDGD